MSLFKRPAWAKQAPTAASDEPDDSETNIFSHSSRSYREIVAEQERKKREKLERKKVKEERRNSGKREVEDEFPREDGGCLKKRRITQEDGENLLGSIGLSSKVDLGAQGGDEWKPVVIEDEEPVRRSPRMRRGVDVSSPRRGRRGREVVEVVGDDDEEGVRQQEEQIVYEAPPPEPVEVEEESDDEFAELKRKARLARQQKELSSKKSQTPDLGGPSPSPGMGASDTGHGGLPTPPPDPVVEIMVTSQIPNTNPLIVHRKISQRTQEVRTAWCGRQGFTEEMTRDVFFIHRMRKIYDATTCRSLGLYVDAFGNVVMKGAEDKDGVEKVHLEAVTEEIFQEMKAQKAIEEKRRSGELPPEEEPQDGAGAEEETPVPEEHIRLTLKGKGTKNLRIKVKPTTLFSKIANAYRKSHHLDDSATISLELDGERLNPDHEVQSTDISDLDCLMVHVN
ncbi:uncharacterized protein LTR77_002364 [Saxophila tyrrhenica]|uniref:Rad60/SUMO-like domain-containing protein n=1 Tax=Saxophila tyrrhenica TaxID=1690608 RepID=A0AAV9PLT8_9PEZI|nr:hypothetical protein LTR77_002364 [Saxophila tyrrhenica]